VPALQRAPGARSSSAVFDDLETGWVDEWLES
jgi:hypothetical protein